MSGRTRNSTAKRGARKQSRPAPAPKKKATNATIEATAAIAARLAERWPGVVVELDHQNAYQLLVATILAAQSTDKVINTLTPAVFARYPDPASLAQANPGELEPMVFKSGFYRQKSAALIRTAQAIVANFGGEVPTTMEGLVSLPGVARKTANVVLGNAMGKNEGIVVDTHITRLAPRLGLSNQTDPVKIENELMQLVPQGQWTAFGNHMIHHGRYLCRAKDPQCEQCPIAPLCPSNGLGMLLKQPKPKPPKATPKAKAKAMGAKTKKPGRT